MLQCSPVLFQQFAFKVKRIRNDHPAMIHFSTLPLFHRQTNDMEKHHCINDEDDDAVDVEKVACN